MHNTLIATWRMAQDGIIKAMDIDSLEDAVTHVVINVEDNPLFHSVGYGGLPNSKGEVELDAAFMDGDTLNYGAVAAVQHIKNPILVAKTLSRYQRNNVLTGHGAFEFAVQNGFEARDNRYPLSQRKWRNTLQDLPASEQLEAYDGHDTVCVLGCSPAGKVCAGVSTSGLFLKNSGRIGDSPVIGSGCFADSAIGAAAATGVGEDIMKGCLSWEAVRLMQEYSPQYACEKVVAEHTAKLMSRKGECGSISLIAINNKGEWGAATNKEEFSFVIGQPWKPVQVWLAHCRNNTVSVELASEEWLSNYLLRLNQGSGN